MEAGQKTLMAIGRRKSATAVVKLTEGTGAITVNKKTLEEYFVLFYHRNEAVRPFVVTETKDKFNVEIKAEGGGVTGQVDAVKLGIARALVKFEPTFTAKLREFDLLTRDPRMKERKKYGQKGARKKFQWTKR